MIGEIPAVILYNQKSQKRGIGISDLTDVALLQQSIYNELSEMEQLIRLSNHPSLVKTPNVEASAGAGSIIEMPEDMDANLKPYIIQPSSQSLDSIMKTIQMKVNAIDRITHMGSVRGTEKTVNSGIALQSEFQLLNARLSEKADLLENAEETIWSLFAKWQNKAFDGEIDYPDTFDLRDYAADLQFLQVAKASGVVSDTFAKEAIDTLNQNLSENGDKFVCIIAGYPLEIERCFFSQNEGLKRRFPFKYTIEKYDANELANILQFKIKEINWNFDESLNIKNIEEFIEKHKKNFENYGGDIDNLLLNMKIKHSTRVFGKDPKIRKSITFEDLTNAYEEFVKMKKDKELPQYVKDMYC